MSRNKLIVIVGPTASGKSDLALRLAKLAQGKLFKKMGINGAEIISADSRQVYRGMNLGTGKVKRDGSKELAVSSKGKKINSEYYSEGIRHHLIDVVSPKKQFTADDFKKLGEKSIENILAKGKIPVIVGGTGFYIDILLGRMAVAQVSPNNKLRAQFDKLTAEKLFEKLEKLDPAYSKIIDRHNKRRLIRALEIVITTGKPVPTYNLQPTTYNILWLGLKPKDLEKRIAIRLDQRLKPSFAKASAGKQGMIKEVRKLHEQGVSWKRLDDFGLEYRWISKYLKKKISHKEMRGNLLKDIVKYSKRQMTWFKRNKDIHWIINKKVANKLVTAFLIQN